MSDKYKTINLDITPRAYEKGQADYISFWREKKLERCRNPYPEGTNEWAEWFSGWYDAARVRGQAIRHPTPPPTELKELQES